MGRTTLEDFLERARLAHGSRYGYSKVEYTTTEKKVIITCKEHGDFLMRPRAHYQDLRGCPQCDDGKKSGFSYNSKWAQREKTLYFIELYDRHERFVKIGVSEEQDLIKRFQKGQFPYEHKVIWSMSIENATEIEREIKNKFSTFQFSPKKEFRGHMECFSIEAKSSILKKLIEIE